MPEKFMFFDTTPDDPREYPASQFAEYFSKFLTNGILNGGTNLQVACPGTDMTVSIALGFAWIKGYLYGVHTSPITLELPDADAAMNRIDRIVLRLDTTLANRYIKAFVVEGTPAASPVPPALVRNDNVYEISLAQVLVIAGRSYIDGSQITDERLDTSVCGLVNSLIQADTTDIFNQFQAWLATKTVEFEAEWDEWFSTQQANSGAFTTQADFNTHVADYIRQPGYGTSGGSANAYTLAPTPSLAAYAPGVCFAVKIHAANTTSSTINVSGLGAKTIKDSKGNNLTAGKLRTGGVYTLRYDGSNFILQGEGGFGDASASDLLSGKTASVDAGDITGTMANNPSPTATLSITGAAKPTKTVAEGYNPGGIITAQLDPSLAPLIKENEVVGGVTGTLHEYLTTANLTPSTSDLTIFSDETYYYPPTSSDESGAVKYVDKTINFKGSARISFLVGRMTYAAIYKNGVRVTDWNGNMDSQEYFTYRFVIPDLNINDTIQIYAYTKPSTQYTTAINRLEGIWFNISPMVT